MTDIIEVKDLKKSFGTLEAVKGISLSVEPGTTFGFLEVSFSEAIRDAIRHRCVVH